MLYVVKPSLSRYKSDKKVKVNYCRISRNCRCEVIDTFRSIGKRTFSWNCYLKYLNTKFGKNCTSLHSGATIVEPLWSQQKMSWKCYVTLCLHDFCQLSFFHYPLYFRWCLTYQGSSSRSPVLSEFWPNWTVVPMSRHIFAEIERDEIRLVEMKEVAAVCNYQSWWDHIGTFVTCKTQDKVGVETFFYYEVDWRSPKMANFGPKMVKHGRFINVPKWYKMVQKGPRYQYNCFDRDPFGLIWTH